MADEKAKTDESNELESQKSYGPSPQSAKAQQEYYDRAVDLNDQLKYAQSLSNDKTKIDKEQLKISNDLVNAARKLNTEYANHKESGKDLSKWKGKVAEIEKIQSNLGLDLTKQEKGRALLAANKEQGVRRLKGELANIAKAESQGLAIDTEAKANLENKISNQQKGYFTLLKKMSAEERSFMIGIKQKKLTEDTRDHIEEQHQKQLAINTAMGGTGVALGIINSALGGALGNTEDILKNSREQIDALIEQRTLHDKNGKVLKTGVVSKMEGLGIQAANVGKSIKKNLNDPLMYLKIALDYSDQINKFQKGLGLSYSQAAGLRAEMTAIAAASGDMAVNSKKVLEVFMSLNTQFGAASTTLATTYPEVVEQATVLQKVMGLSAESTAEFARYAIMSGKPLKQIKEDTIGAVKAAEAETGARLNIKEVMDQIGQVSGQVRAQLEANPEALAKAIATAKQFGMELKDIEATSKALLQFQSSIENELKAELLTGKQLNLEKARLASLTGDYETLAKEINKNVGTFADWSKMNVLQQDALATAMGMTSDQMSDQLLKKANLVQLAQEARAEGNEELAQQLEARSAAEKFQDTVEKIKGVFTDLVGGPLAGFIDLLAGVLNILSPILEVVGYIAASFAKLVSFDFGNMSILEGIVGSIVALLAIMRMRVLAINFLRGQQLVIEQGINLESIRQIAGEKISAGWKQAKLYFGIAEEASQKRQNVLQGIGNRKGVFGLLRAAGKFIMEMMATGAKAGFPAGLVLPFVLGGIAGGIAATMISKFSKGDDVISGGYGKRVLSTPEGSIALNNKDTVIAGTNLEQGDDIISKPAGSVSAGMNIDYTEMAKAMSNTQVSATMNYKHFEARDSQGGAFYGRQAGLNKIS
tara:strand:+ start:1134 stop:3764 length:2631 start_codon:yes stop_codon:yes gene_type:complete